MKFLDLILIADKETRATDAQIVIVGTVDLEVIRTATVSVNRKSGAVGVRAAATVLRDAGNVKSKVSRPPPAEFDGRS